jgi:hypothetical protein
MIKCSFFLNNHDNSKIILLNQKKIKCTIKKPIENKEQLRRSTQAATKKQKPIENREQVRRSNFN